jgi:hypothetical protein
MLAHRIEDDKTSQFLLFSDAKVHKPGSDLSPEIRQHRCRLSSYYRNILGIRLLRTSAHCVFVVCNGLADPVSFAHGKS